MDDLEYRHITREQLLQFQRDARDRGDDTGVEVAAEAIRLMGLARMWKQRAEAEGRSDERRQRRLKAALDEMAREDGYGEVEVFLHRWWRADDDLSEPAPNDSQPEADHLTIGPDS